MNGWRSIQRENITSLKALAECLALPLETFKTSFPINIPKRLVEKMNKGDLQDPLLKQFLPTTEEEIVAEGFTKNPVGDCEAIKCGRLLHKYEGRVLLTTSSACAMYCRYCFRRHFPYETESRFEHEVAYIAKTPSIHEVILSGGDPLSLSDANLQKLIQQLEAIPHLKILRFHSRFPIGIPERITQELLEMLQSRLQVVFVIHCNHPRELDQDVIQSLNKLKLPLLNQSVLLKGVNDNIETLKELSLKLVTAGIMPYYLHQLDRVAGAAHFEVPQEKGLALIEEMKNSLPGYAVPRYVREIAGERCKTTITCAQQSASREDKALFPILAQ